MTYNKANMKAVDKYKKNNYKQFNLTMPKGDYEKFLEAVKASGESINGYIKKAIAERMERETQNAEPQNMEPES